MHRTLLTVAFLSTAGSASASEFCVANEVELTAALQAAESTPEADHIKLRDVVIPVTASLFFWPFGTSTGALKMSGGWDESCASRKFGAQWTRLQASTPHIQIALSPDDDLTVTDLHAVGFVAVVLNNSTIGPAVTTLRLSRVGVFNDTFAGDALSMFSDAERIEVDNLFVDAVAGCAVATATFSDVGQVTIRNSTIIARKNPDFGSGGAAICFDGAQNAELNASINSIFNSSDGIDVQVNGRQVLMQSSAYSDAGGLSEPLDPESNDNLVMPLAFEDSALDPIARFMQAAHSTAAMPELVDSGTPQNLFSYPYDVLGRPRGFGGAIDRGAFEIDHAETLFRNGFEGS